MCSTVPWYWVFLGMRQRFWETLILVYLSRPRGVNWIKPFPHQISKHTTATEKQQTNSLTPKQIKYLTKLSAKKIYLPSALKMSRHLWFDRSDCQGALSLTANKTKAVETKEPKKEHFRMPVLDSMFVHIYTLLAFCWCAKPTLYSLYSIFRHFLMLIF